MEIAGGDGLLAILESVITRRRVSGCDIVENQLGAQK